MSLLAWWPLTGILKDYSGNGYTLTNTNSIIDNIGKMGKCYSFDGNCSRKLFIKNFPELTENFTWCVWFKPIDVSSKQFIVSQGRDYSKFGMNITLGNNKLCIYIGTNTLIQSKLTLEINKWYHVALTSKGTNCRLYINGNLDTEFTRTTMDYSESQKVLVIGKMAHNYSSDSTYFPFKGKINDVRIYNNSLSKKEIYDISKCKMIHYKLDNPYEEPSVNIVSQSELGGFINDGGGTWEGHYAVKSIEEYSTPFGNKKVGKTVITYKGSGGGGSRMAIARLKPSTVKPNTQYSVGYYLWADDNLNYINPNMIYIREYNSSSTQVKEFGIAVREKIKYLGNKWYYIYNTFTTTQNTANFEVNLYVYPYKNIVYRYLNIMVEEKKSNTPFTYSNRESLVGDCSGFRNHATTTLLESPYWTEDSKIGFGSFKFENTSKLSNGYYRHIKSKEEILIPEQGTLSFFLKSEGTQNSDNKYAAGFTNFCSMNNNNWLGLIYYDTADHYVTQLTNINFNDDKWHMYTVSWDNINHKIILYKDGVKQAELKSTPNMFHVNTRRLFVVGSAWSVAYGGYTGKISDVRVYATVLTDTDVSSLYKVMGSLGKNSSLSIKNIKESINLFNPNTILQRQKEININSRCILTKYKDCHTIALSASSFYTPSDKVSHSIFPDNYFKPNTSYKIKFRINSKLIYQGNEVTAGFSILYSDGSKDNTFIIKTGGVWKDFYLITPSNKTIKSIQVGYYIADLFYVDIYNSYIVENTLSNITNKGILNSNHIIENKECSNFKIYKNGSTESISFIEN